MKTLNFKIILSFLGLASVLNGLFMLLAVPFSIHHEETAANGIITSGVITIFLGFLLWFFNRKASKNLGKKEGYLIVTFGWVLLALTGTLPYLLTNSIPTFTDALF
ncbi:MAG: TrkH family potassium uptake protein, partial [Flavobacteriaceae bacterium]|nr:TrkH family potassium uptake protein [Flavobacteriaceae bacterium]